jgi:hypothetical protein
VRYAPPQWPSICGNAQVIEMSTADAAVLAVVEQALDPELLAAVVDRTAEKLAGQAKRHADLEAQLKTVEAQIRRATAAILTGGELLPLVEALRELESGRQRLERELKARSATFDRAKLRQALQRTRRIGGPCSGAEPRTLAQFCGSSLPSGSCSPRTRPAGICSGEKAISAYYFKWRPQRDSDGFGTAESADLSVLRRDRCPCGLPPHSLRECRQQTYEETAPLHRARS